MKRTAKLIALFVTLATLLTLVGCSGAMDAGGTNLEGGAPMQNAPAAGQESADTLPPEEIGTIVENPFINTAENNISTFSADVDTASYAYFRKLVSLGYSLSDLQGSATHFRTEEFINYFRYAATAPAEGELFGITSDLMITPWDPNTMLMRLTLQSEVAVTPVANNLVFLIDVSGSMGSTDKLPLLKKTFSSLVNNLTSRDVISIVTYSGKEAVVLDGCRGDDSAAILDALEKLTAKGSTNGEAGLTRAYALATEHFIEGGNNRIIMASDGDLNVGISSQTELKAYVEGKRDLGIYLSVLGFGTGNYRDSKMEALADNGNGIYYYIDGESEAEKVLGSDLLSTLYTVAEDVKLQLTFDPRFVSAYRLIGYENRILNTEDFTDDTKDAGEVGAGHQVTVCYELKLTDASGAATEPWMSLGLRYKRPGEDVSIPRSYDLFTPPFPEVLSEDLLFITCVIQTVMLIQNSSYLTPDITIQSVLNTLNSLDLSAHPDRMEFKTLVEQIAK